MARGGGRLRRAALTVFASLLLLSVLGLVGEVPAQVNLAITQRDTLSFEPSLFTAAPGESVSLALVNGGVLTHTFTLFAQADANVPVSSFAALQNYFNANTKIVDLSLPGGAQQSTAFTAPMMAGIYTFVCMTPGHAAAGMHGIMTVTTGVPPPDTTKPTVTVTSPADGSHLASTSVTVSGTASDDVGVEKVELSLDGTNWVPATGTTTWSGTLTLSEGPNTIFARATDTSGNTATVSITVTVTVETPPGFQVSQTVIIVAGVVVAAVAAGGALLLWRRRAGGKEKA